MARYIDIEKEIATLQSVLDKRPEDKDTVAYFAFEKIIEMLKIAPTADVVEVVRCKNCEHYDEGRCNHFGYHTYSPDVDEDDFCSYGRTN